MSRSRCAALALLLLVFGAGFMSTAPRTSADDQAEPEKLLRHVVLFKFKDDSKPEDVKMIEDAFCALPSKIDGVVDFEWGTDTSPEGLAKGFTHCFFVTFKSAKDRDAYLPHEAHQEFVKMLRPHLADVLVVDYWAQD